jgi:ABC-type branched-subunit amino acid transport system substrate-binding protein
MVPNAWFGGSSNPQSEKMVAEYIKKYGGTAADVNADVAEAYAVGQVITAAVKATGGFDNTKIISTCTQASRSRACSVPVKFNTLGENNQPTAYTFQWQGAKFVEVNPDDGPGSDQDPLSQARLEELTLERHCAPALDH